MNTRTKQRVAPIAPEPNAPSGKSTRLTRRVKAAGMYGRLRYCLRMKRRPRSVAGYFRLLWEDFVVHVLFEGGEVCQDCGRRYPLWHADYDENLWERVIGHGGGLLCPSCFARRATDAGVSVEFIAVERVRYISVRTSILTGDSGDD